MPSKIRKNKLEINYTYDFELLGIRTALKGYKLAWQLNKILNTRLVKQKDLEIHYKKGTGEHEHFLHKTMLNEIHLFRNKPLEAEKSAPVLVPEFPHFDFILMTRSEEKLSGNRLQEYLRGIPSIEWLTLIPLSALKSKDHFIF